MDYVNVKIPKILGDAIDKLVNAGIYASRAEFVKDAIRRRLETDSQVNEDNTAQGD